MRQGRTEVVPRDISRPQDYMRTGFFYFRPQNYDAVIGNLNGVVRTGFGIANFRYNFVKMLGNMFNIPCAFASFYLKFANSKIL